MCIRDSLHIIHFDAHADLRDDYLGAKLSHACVIRRCHELLGDGRIYQFGIRSGDREEWSWGREHVYTHRFNLAQESLMESLRALQGKQMCIRDRYIMAELLPLFALYHWKRRYDGSEVEIIRV